MTGYVAYLLRAGLKDLARRRHEYLTNERHTNCAQSRTVLITGIPKKLLTEDALRQFASFVPGGVAHVWIYRASKVNCFGDSEASQTRRAKRVPASGRILPTSSTSDFKSANSLRLRRRNFS